MHASRRCSSPADLGAHVQSPRTSAQGLLQGFLGCRWQGQRHDGNALIQELQCLLRGGLATDGTLLDLAVVHAPGFVGKTGAYILRIRNDFAGQLQPGCL